MANPTREAIIDASASIKRLREEIGKLKAELRSQEAALDKLLSGEDSAQPQVANLEVSAADSIRSLNQRIVDRINSSPSSQFDADTLFTEFPDANQTSIRSALSRLAEQGRIERVGRGLYTSTRSDIQSSMELQ
ncbi:MAG: type IV toxin-antitoxin system AbiEi family antitoxin domain-containing protein [Acidimicrobiia bacterium]|nr:type IV toxin-antitoxin system AbiEi family antitoxin domain-containing protein [Acidimicrobiia bacterium]